MTHTHYDNLKVARNAPLEVIRASYKALAQKYHPDKNPDNSDAGRIMMVLNQSYEVLSDPIRRAAHDQWIAEQEAAPRPTAPTAAQPPAPRPNAAPPPRPTAPAPPQPAPARPTSPIMAIIAHVFSYWVIYLGLGIWIWWANTDHTVNRSTSSTTKAAAAAMAAPAPKPRYVRPVNAPNGRAWPYSAAYLAPQSSLSAGGLSSVTIDNSSNDADVHVKLILIYQGTAFTREPMREFFIPTGQQFALRNVAAGTYEVRYRDLNSGALAGSEQFTLVETPTYNGTQFSNMTMTLYKVRNGNMQTHSLDEGDF